MTVAGRCPVFALCIDTLADRTNNRMWSEEDNGMSLPEIGAPSLPSRIRDAAAYPRWSTLGQLPEPAADRVKDHTFRFAINDGSKPASEARRDTGPLLVRFETHDLDIKARGQRYLDTGSAYKKRIRELTEQAELDGYSLRQPSKAAFLEFIGKHPLISRGRLILMENGNLRAVWKDENGTHIGLQFLDNRSIQYVIFKQRETSAPVSRVYGRDTMKGISKQIDAFDLDDVLYK